MFRRTSLLNHRSGRDGGRKPARLAGRALGSRSCAAHLVARWSSSARAAISRSGCSCRLCTNLAGSDLLDEGLQIIGVDHSDNTDEGWRSALTDAMQSFTKDATAEFHADSDRSRGVGVGSAAVDLPEGRLRAAGCLRGARPPAAGQSHLLLGGGRRGSSGRWSITSARPVSSRRHRTRSGRVVIEKPFGSDLASAQALNARILKSAEESPVLPDRPLPREGDGAEHHGDPLRQFDVRTDLAT